LQRFEAVEPHMGTLVGITVYCRTASEASADFRHGFDRIAELNRKLSDYLPDSELNRLNTEPQPVSEDLYRVLSFARTLSERTGGAFDVTIGPLTRLWRLRQPFTDEARALVNWRELKLADGKAWLGKPGMRLDLGAIGKGFAADEALKSMKSRDALIAASGDIVVRGHRDWRVQAAGGIVKLSNAAVSTSGDSTQYFIKDGQRYSHIIDPRSGASVTGMLEVSVRAPDGMTADALATAARVMGRQAAQPVLDAYRARLVGVKF
jgi:thiamine biosynthesis lipoprotein